MNNSANFNLATAFFNHSQANPNSIALHLNEKNYTYSEIANLVSRAASWLREATKLRNDKDFRVGILASRSLETYVGILAACWSGATYIPISLKAPEQTLRGIFEQTQLDALIIDENGYKKLEGSNIKVACRILASENLAKMALESIALVENWHYFHNLATQTPLLEPLPIEADKTAYIIFTSGTTGIPKGVMIKAESVRHYISHLQSLYQIGPNDRVSNFSEVSFDFSVLDLWLAWNGGASLHVVPPSQLMAPARFIQDQQLTFWASVPSAITFLERVKLLKENSFPSLRISYFCGEPLSLASALAWKRAAPNSHIDNHYGPTEATVACSMQRVTDEPSLTSSRGIISIGKPYPKMKMAIVDDEARFLTHEKTGELALSGPQITIGYLGDAELTNRRLRTLKHPIHGCTTWYLTGDMAFEDSEGTFHHLGRIDNQVKVFGHRVELEELDAQLRKVCKVDSVATVAWPVRDGSAEGIVAFVSGTDITVPEIQKQLKKNLSPWVLPKKIIEIESIPLTPNGKIDRKALFALLSETV